MDLSQIAISLFSSSLGLAYVTYGKKSGEFRFIPFGAMLIFYSYFTDAMSTTIWVGIALTAGPFIVDRIGRKS